MEGRKLKIIALYLPQYHTIPENDKWWGEGFTDWVNVKKAKPLFAGHNQPRVPLNSKYYNLLDKEDQVWQARLAKENGVYGFCYYHYWFNGKQLLEQPLNNMLNTKEIELPFCICWANEPWSRTWDGSEKEMLMPQEYGGEKEWIEHFNYLLKAFKDSRYIKVCNKPMLVIYRTESIDNCSKMFDFWNNEAIKNGFNGLHIVEMMTGFQDKPQYSKSEAVMEFEPNFTLRYDISQFERVKRRLRRIIRNNKFIFKENCPKALLDVYSYDKIWTKIVNRRRNYSNRKVYPGAFVGWDNSPRKGINSMIFNGESVDKFGKYINQQIEKTNEYYKSEYIFINAWNEWAEGTYLEPDKKNGNAYLEIIKNANRK